MPKGNDLPHVKRVRSKGRDYYYFDTGVRNQQGKRIYNRLPDIKAPDFGSVYAAMKAGVTRRVDMSPILTVGALIRHYERSPEFNRLSDGTQRTYGYALRKIEAQMARAPVDDVEPRDLAVLLAKLGNAAGTVNITRSVMAALFKWGRRNNLVGAATDPVGDRAAVPMGSHEPWPVAILDAALACDVPRVKLSVHLLYYTAQRIGDVCAMRWSDIRDGTISVVQRKTGRTLTIQMHQALADMLAATPKRGLTILTRADGGPIGDDAIRKEIQAFTAGYGVKLVPHGLRKNAVIALLEAGCSVAEAASVSGQSFAMVEYYAKQRDQKILSSAAVLKWQERK
jgi:integrase